MRIACLMIVASSASIAAAQEPEMLTPLLFDADLSNRSDDDPIGDWNTQSSATNLWSLQLLTGYYKLRNSDSARTVFLPDGMPNGFADFVYAPQVFRLEYTPLQNCSKGTWRQGSGSLLFEASGAVILRDFGKYVAGPSLLARHTFMPEHWRVHPYIQGGVGLVFTDADKDQTQRMIGGPIEFLVQAQVGLKIPVAESWSLDVETGYQHISNADTRSRNFGVNAVGASVGVTYHF